MKKNKDFTKFILSNAFLIFAAETIIGTVSNVFVFGAGVIGSFISIGQGAVTEERSAMIWLFLAVIALLVCGIGIFLSAEMIGGRAADYRYNHHKKIDLNIPPMLVSVLVGNMMHALLCTIMSWETLQTLFIAGPVQYIARLLGGGTHSFFAENSLKFSHTIVVSAILIYITILTVLGFIGYAVGHGKKIASIKKAEENAILMSRRHVKKQDSTNNANTPPQEDITRTRLSSDIEKRMMRINRNRIVAAIVFIAIWFIADAALWLIWSIKSGHELLSPNAAFFTALLIVPFYPLRMHERIFGKTYYAEIADIRIMHEKKMNVSSGARAVGGKIRGTLRTSSVEVCILYIRPAQGTSIKLVFPCAVHLPYVKGEHVLKLSSFDYPVRCSISNDFVFCPKCLKTHPKNIGKCTWCGQKLG